MSESPRQRARKPEDKQARREQILAAAERLFATRPLAEIKMAEIAAEAGLAKGTPFIYFATKEALFLELLGVELDAWLREFDDALASGRGPWSASRVARLAAETLAPRTTFTRLLTLLSSVLEHNVDVEQIAVFKLGLVERLARTGELLERRLEFLASGRGAHLVLQIYAVVIGVRQLADPGSAAREALSRPELAPLLVEFERELHAVLLALLRGLEAAAGN